jgi:RNA polymerase sigma-70 factor (family 1)
MLNETELTSLIANGDRNAFALLYKTYLTNIYNYVYSLCLCKETSEEIIQTMFLKLWECRKTLANVKDIKPYLYRCARNSLIDYSNKISAANSLITSLEHSTSLVSQSAENNVIYKEYYQMAQTAIEMLPQKRKQIFKLRLNDDLSLDEIAAKLNISKRVVKKQLYSGITFVKGYLGKHGEIIILFFVTVISKFKL